MRPANPKDPRSTSKWVALGDWMESLLLQHKGRFAKKPQKDEICFDLVFDTPSGLQAFKREYSTRMAPLYWEGPAFVPQPHPPGLKSTEVKSVAVGVLEAKRQECIEDVKRYVASGHTALAQKSEIRAESLARQINSIQVTIRARGEKASAQ